MGDMQFNGTPEEWEALVKKNKVMRIDEINAMAEKVYLEHENNDLLYGDSLELRLAYRAGVVDGYNKAKETLYTEEQVREAMEFARGHSKMTDKQFIKQLKTK